MTLSSFLLRPAQTALISGGVTDSVITASPAILLAIYPGGVLVSPYDWDCFYTIKTGATILLQGRNYPNGASIPEMPSSGIDCANGITITTYPGSGASAATYLANSRITINYILK